MDSTQLRQDPKRRLVRYVRITASVGALLGVFAAAPYVMAAEDGSMFRAWAIATLIGLPVVWARAIEECVDQRSGPES